MSVFKVFQAKSKIVYFFLLLLGAINSITSIGILALINSIIRNEPILGFHENKYLLFIGMVGLSFLGRSFFQHYMIGLTNDVLFSLELSIIRKVRNASYESFERLGSQKIYSAISDARILSRVPEFLITIFTAAITIICSLYYLFCISMLGGAVLLAIMVVLLVVYLVRDKKISKDLNKVRDLQDAYYSSIRELLTGFKQIRISSKRSHNLYEKHISHNRESAKALNIRASRKYMVNELIGIYCWYVVLGVIMFILPVFFQINKEDVLAFITAVLFMMSPLSQIILFFPFYMSSRIAVERIEKINEQLETVADTPLTQLSRGEGFSDIMFEDISYLYEQDEKQSFRLELKNLSINKGEVIFIVGGNGSGKTTFINILTGLCKPQKGTVCVNGQEVEWDRFSSFSNNMAVVYTNHHLFKHNYDEHDLHERNHLFNGLITLFNLKGVLQIDPQKEYFEQRFSKGQEKRVALLLALLERKDILILDEWAAEQDPLHRKYFYEEWITQMREMGKTIIAVTHDDDYFHVADRVIKFHRGEVVSENQDLSKIPQ